MTLSQLPFATEHAHISWYGRDMTTPTPPGKHAAGTRAPLCCECDKAAAQLKVGVPLWACRHESPSSIASGDHVDEKHAKRLMRDAQLISDHLVELHAHSTDWQRQTAAEKQRILSKKQQRGLPAGQPAAQNAASAGGSSSQVIAKSCSLTSNLSKRGIAV